MPRFSIIVVHFQGSTPHEELCRGIASLRAQTYNDYEILAYHNGPLLDTSWPMPVEFRCSERNMNDWGFGNRDRGMREAAGDYIIHFNSDNILYPNALEEISNAIDRAPRIFNAANGDIVDKNNIITYGIILHNYQRYYDELVKYPDHPEYTLTLMANPPLIRYVDALQFVMRRDLWLAEGGWYDKYIASDGIMAQKFALKYGYRAVDMILGEHF